MSDNTQLVWAFPKVPKMIYGRAWLPLRLTFASSFRQIEGKRGRRGREGGMEGWGPSWTLSKLSRLPRWRVYFFIKVCQLGYSDSSILCQNTNTERARVKERESIKKDGEWQKKLRRVLSFDFCHILTVFYTTFQSRWTRSREPKWFTELYFYINCEINHRNYITFTCSHFQNWVSSQKGCLILHSTVKSLNIVAGNECSNALLCYIV